MSILPRLLAGPILRRVDSQSVSVWVATSKACGVVLQVFDSVQAVSADDRLVRGNPTFTGEGRTIRALEHLHVGVVTMTLSGTDHLLPGRTYSYNVQLKIDRDVEDLKSLKLLENSEDVDHPNVALGYEANTLPSFSLPPTDIDQLVVLHGSCRRPAAPGQDAMVFADRIVQQTHGSALERPHILALTGDQIYADDVAPFLLDEVMSLASDLQGSAAKEQLPVVETPGPDPNAAEGWKDVSRDNFPAGKRSHYCDAYAYFTSSDRAQHLLSFSEFAAMYLLVWSPRLWRKAPNPSSITPNDFDPLRLLIDPDRTKAWLFDSVAEKEELKRPEEERKAREAEREEKKRLRAKNMRLANKRQLQRLKEFHAGLSKVARVLANIPTYMIFDDHEITDDWNGVQRFKLEVYSRPAGRAIVRNGLMAYALFQAWGNNPQQWAKDPPASAPGRPETDEKPKEKAERVLRHELLACIDDATCGPKGWGSATSKLDQLLDIPTRAPSSPPVRWHFRYTAQRFEMLGLDSRTRRLFPLGSPVISPGLIDEAGLENQIPAAADPAIEAVLVLAACPVVGPSLMDELVQPAALQVMHIMSNSGKTEPGDAALRKRASFLDRDPEPWGFEPRTFERLLARLEQFAGGKPVVFLSGDVHYSTAAVLDYGTKARNTRFVQLTSSALKNMPDLVTVVDPPLAQRALTDAIHPGRLGWNESKPTPYQLPANSSEPRSQYRNLVRQPLLLSADIWPVGTTVVREPDWWWSYKAVLDERPENFETAPSFASPRPALDPTIEKHGELADNASKEDYTKLAKWHNGASKKLAPRRVVFPTAVCVVKFRSEGPGRQVIQEVHYIPYYADEFATPEAYTVFKVPLEAASEVPSLEKRHG